MATACAVSCAPEGAPAGTWTVKRVVNGAAVPGAWRTSLKDAAPTAESATRATRSSSLATASNSTDCPWPICVSGSTVRRMTVGGALACTATC